MTPKKRGELPQIAKNDLEIAVDELLAMAEGKRSEEFAWSTCTDGGLVLQRDDFLKERRYREKRAKRGAGLEDHTFC